MIQQVNRRINCFASPHQKISATFRFVGCSGLQNLYIHCKYELNKGMKQTFFNKTKIQGWSHKPYNPCEANTYI